MYMNCTAVLLNKAASLLTLDLVLSGFIGFLILKLYWNHMAVKPKLLLYLTNNSVVFVVLGETDKQKGNDECYFFYVWYLIASLVVISVNIFCSLPETLAFIWRQCRVTDLFTGKTITRKHESLKGRLYRVMQYNTVTVYTITDTDCDISTDHVLALM